MADPDNQAQLGTGSTANGAVARDAAVKDAVAKDAGGNGAVPRGRTSRRESEDIVAEIERTRENLARTIDELADRVSPAGNVRRLRERAAAELAKPEVQLTVAAVAVIVTGVVIARLIAGRRASRRG